MTKFRVFLVLATALFLVSVLRQDRMVYGMFLLLTACGVVGFVLPWLSLRATYIAVQGHVPNMDIFEGEACALRVQVARRLWWPAFMVDVETHWAWAGKTHVLRRTISMLRAGKALELPEVAMFPCRGDYRLTEVRLSSDFPLGLVRSQKSLQPGHVQQLVLPRSQAVAWPLAWSVLDDPMGDKTTPRLGSSFDLGVLRKYVYGEPLGRVNWRASGRIGELVIQHFQQSGSVRLLMVADLPDPEYVGQADSSQEQVMRVAAGLCDMAQAQGVRLHAFVTADHAGLNEPQSVVRALAQAEPASLSLASAMANAAHTARVGDQLAVVVGAQFAADELIRLLHAEPALRMIPVVVCICTSLRRDKQAQEELYALQKALSDAGVASCSDFS